MEMLQVENKQDVLGSHVIYIMDPDAFQDVLEGRREVRNYRDYYPEIDKYLEMSIIHNPTAHTLLAILLDVTEAEHNMLEKEKLSRHTAELTDRVVMKQARSLVHLQAFAFRFLTERPQSLFWKGFSGCMAVGNTFLPAAFLP